MSQQIASVATRLKKIREAFVKQLPAQMDLIDKAFSDLGQGPPDKAGLEELHRRIHTMRGSSATFGLSRLSTAAAAGERFAKETMLAEEPPGKKWHGQMQAHIAQMRHDADNIDTAQDMELPHVEFADGLETTKERGQKTIYLCEDDSFQRLALAAQIGCFGFQVVSFGDLEQLRNAVRNSVPDAIVMDLMHPDRPMGGAETIIEIQRELGYDIPTVFISSQNDFPYRLSAVRAGSSAYFEKPINISNICSTLSLLTSAEKPEPYRVMVVDDDTHLAELYATILQGAGMLTQTVNDPMKVMTPLEDFKPDLILTDMHMPGCNGMELAKTIRQIDASYSIPIVFLSRETDTDKQFNAMRMGGDEFLTKPIKSEHLIAAVTGRAERMKIIRSFMVRDSLTGLFNHTTTKEQLDLAIEQARRNGGEVCFAMIDLDKFKGVNDNYGHPAGDRVLVTLARLLQQRLRKTDISGRFGGEEFAVILPACGIAEATALINQLRESFSLIRFPVGDDTFSLTFSAGVASFSHYDDAPGLCKAADEALYKAKGEGRNRVVATAG
jgi:diguanylate cyclase (GGDEF)-like protein